MYPYQRTPMGNPYKQLHLLTLMKRRCRVKQGLRNRWFHLQNEIKTRWGDSKNEIGFDVHHVYEQKLTKRDQNETNHGGKVPKQ